MSAVQNAHRANKGRLDVPSRQLRASHLCDAQAQNYFFFFAFFFFAFFAIGGAPLLNDRKLSRNRLAQKHTMRL
jgi:hypothetical protein